MWHHPLRADGVLCRGLTRITRSLYYQHLKRKRRKRLAQTRKSVLCCGNRKFKINFKKPGPVLSSRNKAKIEESTKRAVDRLVASRLSIPNSEGPIIVWGIDGETRQVYELQAQSVQVDCEAEPVLATLDLGMRPRYLAGPKRITARVWFFVGVRMARVYVSQRGHLTIRRNTQSLRGDARVISTGFDGVRQKVVWEYLDVPTTTMDG